MRACTTQKLRTPSQPCLLSLARKTAHQHPHHVSKGVRGARPADCHCHTARVAPPQAGTAPEMSNLARWRVIFIAISGSSNGTASSSSPAAERYMTSSPSSSNDLSASLVTKKRCAEIGSAS